MQLTYKAILHGDHVEWIDAPPDLAEPVEVHITLALAQASERDRGRAMADALAGLARLGGVSGIADPILWQRQIREDRPLPGREL